MVLEEVPHMMVVSVPLVLQEGYIGHREWEEMSLGCPRTQRLPGMIPRIPLQQNSDQGYRLLVNGPSNETEKLLATSIHRLNHRGQR